MRVKGRIAIVALDGFEAVGLDRQQLATSVGLDTRSLSASSSQVEWSTFTALLDAGWKALGGDPIRMREVGSAIARAPSYALLQRLARTVFSVRRVYDIATRWGAPSTFPHLEFGYEPLSARRLRFRGRIPEPYAPSLPLQHLMEGVLVETSTLLGLPRATIVSSQVTPRTSEVVIDLPPSSTLPARVRRAVHAALHAGDVEDMFEAQRQELMEAVEEARRSTEEHWAILDGLSDYVLIHRGGVILWMNRAGVRALGYERREDVVGRPLLEFVEPAARARVVARMSQPAGAKAPELGELRLMARDGRSVVIEVSPSQAMTYGGEPARLVVGRDVTERARMQERLLVADRMAAIGMLAAGVAHEVNNPLAYVLNNVEIALSELEPLGAAAARARESLSVALEGVDRIRTIVRDLLALSRVNDTIVGPISVRAVVDSTLALAKKEIDARAVLELSLEPVPPVAGSVARLGQVLLNLVMNALEAMREPERERNRLCIAVRPSTTGGAVVEVTDNGVGIPPEHANRVFEPFFTTKPPGKGTGLGLAISRRLVAEMGGELSFESSPGLRTSFRVTLAPWDAPAHRPEARAP
jgi:PAS domain S-box-containing protein